MSNPSPLMLSQAHKEKEAAKQPLIPAAWKIREREEADHPNPGEQLIKTPDVPLEWQKADLQALDWKNHTSYIETAHTFQQKQVEQDGRKLNVAFGRCVRCGRYTADDAWLPRTCEGNKRYTADENGKLTKLRYVVEKV